jgi:shikimate dehydrogenase
MNRIYIAFDVTIEQLPQALRGAAALGFAGVNLTVPHKQVALRVVRDLSAEARLLGAANCIVPRKGGLFGDNTDARGLERDLRDQGVRIAGKTAILIGAGGAAGAAALTLMRMRARRIVVVNRTMARARAMVRRLAKSAGGAAAFEVLSLDAIGDRDLIAEAALVVNATPLGLGGGNFPPLQYPAARPDCMFYDLIYAKRPTPFLAPAIKLGLPASDGAGMLLHQGVLAFRLFNGVGAPVEVMRQALLERLGRA